MGEKKSLSCALKGACVTRGPGIILTQEKGQKMLLGFFLSRPFGALPAQVGPTE